ncbi:MAG TPA: glycosyltransferase family 4 protein [Candidatus Polarisedimenticolia bacterium]
MRILHTDFHVGWGGQAARVLMLSRELALRGHHVTIAAPPGELTRRAGEIALETPGLTVADRFAFRAPGHVLSFARDCRRMKELLSRGDFDIVDVHGSQDTWVTAIVRLLTGLPRRLVMTRHNTKRVRTGLPNRRLYGRLIDHLIIVDESIRLQYAPLLAGGILASDMISVVPSAYRADLFHERVSGTRVRRELGIPEGDPVVGVAGRLVTDKGHIHLMKAACELKPYLPGLVLVFAGTGPNEARLRSQADELGLSASVRFLGFRSDVAEVQAAFDVAVLPSVGCDASSAAIKEAMALGVPVVASDIGGARHIIRDGVTGIIVRPGRPEDLVSALRTLLDDRGSARAMAERAREDVARRFSLDRLTGQTLDAYAAALAARKRARRHEAALPAGKTA